MHLGIVVHIYRILAFFIQHHLVNFYTTVENGQLLAAFEIYLPPLLYKNILIKTGLCLQYANNNSYSPFLRDFCNLSYRVGFNQQCMFYKLNENITSKIAKMLI
ncbi:hypothetical protein T02_9741 [Trichinella nativa]|uniref:Uncharacterized protein n=1 Tax=Trichinella nativa TaxID=6335 RepID=A0A0V1KKQ3_9BILA|nr:hypothetical protein T02_9741 [Trichinella nativa]